MSNAIMHKSSLSFKKSQQAIKDSQKELKSLGKAEIKSTPEIAEQGQTVCIQYQFVFCPLKLLV